MVTTMMLLMTMTKTVAMIMMAMVMLIIMTMTTTMAMMLIMMMLLMMMMMVMLMMVTMTMTMLMAMSMTMMMTTSFVQRNMMVHIETNLVMYDSFHVLTHSTQADASWLHKNRVRMSPAALCEHYPWIESGYGQVDHAAVKQRPVSKQSQSHRSALLFVTRRK